MPRWPAKEEGQTDTEPNGSGDELVGEVFDGAAFVVADEQTVTVEDEETPPGCPHCGGQLVMHLSLDGPKAGAEHCNSCGCCLLNGEPRPGTEHCTIPAAVS